MSTTTTTSSISSVTIEDRAFRLRWLDGHESLFHWIWLRDHGPTDEMFARGTSQRLFDSSTLDLDVRPLDFEQHDDSLVVSWSNGKQQRFTADWLREHCYADSSRAARQPQPQLWGREFTSQLHRHDWHRCVNEDLDRFRLLGDLLDRGLVVIENVPCQPRAVLDAGRLIGYVRQTNYGELFDVRSVPDPDNLAYSSLGLALHTDNPYRHPGVGYQLLHCLESKADGGDSQFVDGFRVAEELRGDSPALFEALTTTPRQFAFRSAESDLRNTTPLIRCDDEGNVTAVYRNDRSTSTLSVKPSDVELFYEAYARFAALLNDERFLVQFKMKEGELVIFDNERVLHARTAFDPASGPRHLQGCYVDRDEVASRARVLAKRLGTIGLDPGCPGGARVTR